MAWHNMKVRCYFEKAESYKRYGARGITVCDRWLESFENFLEDVGESPSPDYTIGRIDNDGNYEPGNVEWQSLKQQCNNRRSTRLITAFKRTQTLQQWSDETGFSPTAITTRIDECGWDAERALSEPKRKQTRPAGNKRVITFRNVTQTLAAWGRSTGIPPSTIARRIDVFGWTVERALTTDNREYHDGSK